MKDIAWIKERLIAHRGLHSIDKTVPENSLTSFALCLEKDYGIECDVNVLGDGTVVVFHDKDLRRLTKRSESLMEVAYEDIKELTLYDTTEKILTLQEMTAFVNGKVPLLIELKPHGDSLLLCTKFMEIMKDYKGVYAIHSFSPWIVNWFRKNHPEVIRGQITEYFRSDTKMKRSTKYLMRSMFFNRFTKPDFVNYGIVDLPNKYCDRAYKKGLCIIAYAAKSQEQLDMVKTHYDNAVFEYFIPEERKR